MRLVLSAFSLKVKVKCIQVPAVGKFTHIWDTSNWAILNIVPLCFKIAVLVGNMVRNK